MSSLWPATQRGNGENVLNGIALGKDHVLLTGKRWDRMYKVVFPDWPSLLLTTTVDENGSGEYEKDDAVTEEVLPGSKNDPSVTDANEPVEEGEEAGDEYEKDDAVTEEVLPGSKNDPSVTDANEPAEEEEESGDEVQNTIVNTFTVLEQVNHDQSSFT